MKIIATILLLLLHCVAVADVVNTNRITTWQGNVGVIGGIPAVSTVYTTLQSSATVAMINTAIQNCPSNQAVVLSNGTWTINGLIELNKNGVVLRGQSATGTVLNLSGHDTSGINIKGAGLYDDRSVGGNPADHSVNWTGGYTKWTNTITVASVSGLAVGDLVVLDQINDQDGVFESQCTICGRGPSTRSQQQFNKVTAINGTQVTLQDPIHMDNWRSAQDPEMWWQDAHIGGPIFIQMVGVENMTINGDGGGVFGDGYPASIFLASFWNVWITNVISQWGGGEAHIQPLGGGHLEIRHCSFEHADNNHGSRSYGVLFFSTTGGWIEDCWFNDVTAPITGGAGSTACVVSYCFTTNSTWYTSYPGGTKYNSPLVTLHDVHETMSMAEGNHANTYYGDFYHGSSSHTFLFRNRFTGEDAGVANYSWVVSFDYKNRSNNIIGNILGKPGWTTNWGAQVQSDNAVYQFGLCLSGTSDCSGTDTLVEHSTYLHGNWNTVSNAIVWNSTNADHTLPNSYLHASKPAWFGNRTWPPWDPTSASIGTIVSNRHAFTNIPAGYRFYFNAEVPADDSPIVTLTPLGVIARIRQ